jgi:hypothetical protein
LEEGEASLLLFPYLVVLFTMFQLDYYFDKHAMGSQKKSMEHFPRKKVNVQRYK